MTVVTVLVLVLTFIGSLDHRRPVQPHHDDGYFDLDSGWDRDSGVQDRNSALAENFAPGAEAQVKHPHFDTDCGSTSLFLECT